MNLKKIARYYHTLKHLKVKQIFFRLYYKIKPIYQQTAEVTLSGLNWQAPLLSASQLSQNGEFNFLHKSGHLKNSSLWNDSSYPKLWLYNLHYFDELNCRTSDINIDLLDDYISTWIRLNPPIHGNGWEPYPLSLRIVNWIKWFSRHPQLLKTEYCISIQLQISALEQQIEYHILANHLFANAKALIFAGCFFKGKKAQQWLTTGLKILKKEIQHQFLEDGAHFELSPMYHAIMLWDICDLINLANYAPVLEPYIKPWQVTFTTGLQWLKAMLHPDGNISFFNDATLGNAPTYADIAIYADSLGLLKTETESPAGLSLQYLKSSGYCAVYLTHDCKAILDTATIGPSYQPGHAHADTLSFELSLFGKRFIVNSGISQYGEDAIRQLQRDTQSHNTVCIDDQNSSDVWAGFRVGKRAKPRQFTTDVGPNKITIQCAHDGYHRLPGKNLHQRTWVFQNNEIILIDQITGRFKQAAARLYFHPDIHVTQIDHARLECYITENQKVHIEIDGAELIALEQTLWFPNFGVQISNTCCTARFFGDRLVTKIILV